MLCEAWEVQESDEPTLKVGVSSNLPLNIPSHDVETARKRSPHRNTPSQVERRETDGRGSENEPWEQKDGS